MAPFGGLASFFFKAEDGIRYTSVTGVQTCALPIYPQFKGTVVGGGRLTIGGREVLVHEGRLPTAAAAVELTPGDQPFTLTFYKNRPWTDRSTMKIGRASCRERE